MTKDIIKQITGITLGFLLYSIVGCEKHAYILREKREAKLHQQIILEDSLKIQNPDKTKNKNIPADTITIIKQSYPKQPDSLYGFDIKNFTVVRDTLKYGDTFGKILSNYNVSAAKTHRIITQTKDSFDTRKIRTKKPYTIFVSNDSLKEAKVFIYQNNRIERSVVDFRDEKKIKAFHQRKRITLKTQKKSGTITHSLSHTFEKEGLSMLVAYKMAEIYAWTIDFSRLRAGDQFKVIYTEKFIDDSISVGIKEIKAAYFKHKNEPIYAFAYEDPNKPNNPIDYFTEKAGSLRQTFLKAPVKFSRITSRFNLRRRIKLYGNRIRPHKGTDFAAPIGTPIVSTADGTVIAARYKRANGNYVKVKHNKTYTTQYLHMKKFAVKKGQFVRQGQVIGYVGMTGNTSGPHVCYRFWKNGKQVDPFKQKLPISDPLKGTAKKKYLSYIAPIKKALDAIVFIDNKAEKQDKIQKTSTIDTLSSECKT